MTTPATSNDYNIDFAAADTRDYIAVTDEAYGNGPGIGRLDGSAALTGGTQDGPSIKTSVESLAKSFERPELGQIVVWETLISVDKGASANGVITLTLRFGLETTSGADYGFDFSKGVLSAFVDTSDKALVDAGGNATVQTVSAPRQVLDEKSSPWMEVDITVAGLDGRDQVPVEVWTVLRDDATDKFTGVVQSRIDRAVTANGTPINVGDQTIPLKLSGATDGGEIDGVKWYDTDGNGQISAGDTRGAGVTIFLDTNNNGTLDNGEAATVTAADGSYSFTGLASGTYHLAELVPTGSLLLHSPGAVVVNGGEATGSTASVITGADFLNQLSVLPPPPPPPVVEPPPPVAEPGHITGTAFAAEPVGICGWKLPGAVFGGVTVQLLGADGSVLASTTTDSSGAYHFDIAAGTYAVRFLTPEGLALLPQHSGWLHDGSDADPQTGRIAGVEVKAGQTTSEADAGFLHLTGSVADGEARLLPAGGNYNGNGSVTPVFLQALGDANVNQPAAGSVILGGAGRLTVSGPNNGAVYAIGGTGWSDLHGGNGGGAVLMTGQGGGNLEGTSGNDILLAGCGATSMQGLGSNQAGSGMDLMAGGRGNDTLEGNQSTAVILGGAGNDAIHSGGAGSILIGGANAGTVSFNGSVITSLTVGDTVNGTGAHTTFVYQLGDGVQWLENFNPAMGDTLQVWGYAAPTAVASYNGCGVLYFGTDAALVINGWQPQNGALTGVEYHAEAAALPGAFGHFNPLAPTVLASTATSFYGTQGDDIALGSDSATVFRGNGGNDYLAGGAGNDLFYGGADGNTMKGEGGDDTFFGATGSDSVDGGSGTDKVVYSFAHAGASLLHLANGDWEVLKPQGVDLLHDVEKVQFSDGVLTLATNSFTASLANDPDFNGDGLGDLLFRNADGSLYQWQMNGATVASQGAAGWVGNDWHIAGTADFSGDGRADILWHNDNGAYYLWEMNGTAIAGGGDVVNPGGTWQVAAIGDFNGDGKSDLLWRNADGALYSWEMNGNTLVAGHDFGTISTEWQVKLSADLTGDGRADIVWQNSAGSVYLWQMNGGAIVTQGSIGSVGSEWQLVGSGDFNADGKADLLWQNQTTGMLYEWQMNGFGIASQGVVAEPGLGWHVSEIEDLNGDHKADLVLTNTTGGIYALMMNGLAVTAGHDLGSVDAAWHLV